MTIHVPWYNDSPGTNGLINWYTGGRLSNHCYAATDRVTTPMSPQLQQWELWCFTKDNYSGIAKIYRNGEIVAAHLGTPLANKFQNFDTNQPCYGSSSDNGGLAVGSQPGVSGFWGAIDEVAIFDAGVSPADVNSTGTIVPGVPAVRFIEMFQAGSPGN